MNRPRLLLLMAGLSVFVISLGVYGHARIAFFMDAGSLGGADDKNAQILGLLFPSSKHQRADDDQGVAAAAVIGGTTTGARAMTMTADTEHTGDASLTTTTRRQHDDTAAKDDGRIKNKHLDKCGNSKRWLNGQRHGNLRHDPLFTDDLAQSMILNLKSLLVSEQRHTILGQSICHADGRFRNDTAAGQNVFDDRTVRLWAVRLIYYAMHYHQHRLAVPEAVQRYHTTKEDSCSPEMMLKNHNVSLFDYECPSAKYIITSLGGNGLVRDCRLFRAPNFRCSCLLTVPFYRGHFY